MYTVQPREETCYEVRNLANLIPFTNSRFEPYVILCTCSVENSILYDLLILLFVNLMIMIKLSECKL